MTKKSQARLERDRTKAERTRMANLLGTHPDSRLMQSLTTKLPGSPMFGSPLHSPAVAAARAAYLKTDPMLMVKELAESFQGLEPGTPEHTAAAERAEAALAGMSQMKLHPYQEAAVRDIEARYSTERDS